MQSRIAVLASGGGSNLQAILDHFDRVGDRRGGHVVLVGSAKERAGALERAAQHGLLTAHVAAPGASGGVPLEELIQTYQIDLLVLAGYLRLVPSAVVRRLQGRILNVHPALLPAFGGQGMYGRRVHEAVIASGATVSGVTVHYVDEQYDHGRIAAQWPVPVLADDDADRLAARVLRVEHVLYPRVVDAVAAGRLTPATRGMRGARGGAEVAYALLNDDTGYHALADDIDRSLAL